MVLFERNMLKNLKILELANVLAGPAVGMFFSELVVCIGLYGCRVFEAVSYVFYDPFL